MNYIKNIEEFLSEAISMKMYKENLPKEYWYDKSEGYKSWDKLFGEGINRISIPLVNDNKLPKSTPNMRKINKVFQQQGYKINSFIDYIDNKAYKIGDTKNPLKIGKLLSKIDQSLFSLYDTDPDKSKWKQILSNKEKALKIIISRHPYDLLGMTSGRDWRLSSCMALGSSDDKVYLDILASMGETDSPNEFAGAHKGTIANDIKYGVLIAYVVNIDDDNINRPLCRLLIKPYINRYEPFDTIWASADKIYGKVVDGFKESVDKWISTWQDDYYGYYCMNNQLYTDFKLSITSLRPLSEWTESDYDKFLFRVAPGGTWSINKDKTVDIKGNVYIDGMGFKEIPIPFGYVDGSFYCNRNYLTSLKNAPHTITGDFVCSDNKLTNLKYCPRVIKKDFRANGNLLTSLNNFPKEVWGGVFIYNNKLKDLTGIKIKRVNHEFVCSENELTSLKGAPEYVGYRFDCSQNKLNSLEFAPKEVGGNFICQYNHLTSLEGSPKKVHSYLINPQINGKVFSLEDIDGITNIFLNFR